MGLFDILKGLIIEYKKIDITKLPSQGLFYKDDFSIKIKKAEIEDILEYEHNFNKENLIASIDCVKKIVNNNVVISNQYSYLDVKSVDIIFLFLEIVKYTTGKNILVSYLNKEEEESFVTFDENHFNYFKFDNLIKYYDNEGKDFLVDGYRFSLPSIGIESSLTKYLTSKITDDELKEMDRISYDFMFFLGSKNQVSFEEIDNLINIFNYDLEKSEISKVKSIVNKFKGIISYSLVIEGEEVGVRSKINLKDIWKN